VHWNGHRKNVENRSSFDNVTTKNVAYFLDHSVHAGDDKLVISVRMSRDSCDSETLRRGEVPHIFSEQAPHQAETRRRVVQVLVEWRHDTVALPATHEPNSVRPTSQWLSGPFRKTARENSIDRNDHKLVSVCVCVCVCVCVARRDLSHLAL